MCRAKLLGAADLFPKWATSRQQTLEAEALRQRVDLGGHPLRIALQQLHVHLLQHRLGGGDGTGGEEGRVLITCGTETNVVRVRGSASIQVECTTAHRPHGAKEDG